MRNHFVFALAVFSVSAAFAQTAYKFDFGPGPVKAGYTQVLANTNYTTARGYGFDFYVPVACVDRGGNDSLLRDVCYNTNYFYFSMNLAEGNYTLSVTLGDQSMPTITTIKAESRRLFVEKAQTAAGEFQTKTFTVNRRNTAVGTTGNSVGITTREGGGLNWDGNKLTIEFNNARPSVASLEIAPAAAPRQIFLAGNSTVCDWATETETAWGQMIPRFFKPTASIVSLAEAGLTAASFTSQRRLDKIISLARSGDYLFIEFAHNDMGNVNLSQYRTNLAVFITRARNAGVVPVLVSPTARRSFDTQGKAVNTFVNTNGDYVAAMKSLAQDSGVTLIDLNAMTSRFIETLGVTGSASAYWVNLGTQDNTHFNNYGAYEVAKMVVEGIRTGIPALVPYLTDDVVPFDPTRPDTGWSIPQSADTSVWHNHVTGIVKGRAARIDGGGYSLSIDPASLSVAYASAGDITEFYVYTAEGSKLAERRVAAGETRGAFQWKELDKLPNGEYFLRMKAAGKYRAKLRFVKD